MSKRYIVYMIFSFICFFIIFITQILTKFILLNIDFFRDKPELVFYIKLSLGTIAGFLTKFIIDKFLIFKEKHENIARSLKQIFIYGMFSVLTTAIFWGFQISFKYLFEKYYSDIDMIGGAIGLLIGYTVKYILDKNFVFTQKK